MVDPVDHERVARAFPAATATSEHATSKVPKRKTDSPAQMRGMFFLPA